MNNTDAPILFILGTLTILVFVFFLVLIVIEYRRRQVKHVTEKLELKHQYQNQVLQTQIEVQEQSFKYISEEIHDNVAQALSLARLKLFKTISKVTDEQLKAGIESSSELLGNALNDLRNLSHVLNGGLVAKLTLAESIDKELGYIRDVNDMHGTLNVAGDVYELGAEKKLLTFRIVQEAINNALKHGKATQININLEYRPGILIVQIADNGKGFDMTQMKESKGLGLHNMQIRAKLLGSIDVTSAADKGTIITLNINMHEQ